MEASAIANFCPGHCLSPIEKGMQLPGCCLIVRLVKLSSLSHLQGWNQRGFQWNLGSTWFTRWHAIMRVSLSILVPSEKVLSLTAILSIPVTTGGASLNASLMHALRVGRLFIKAWVGRTDGLSFYLSYRVSFYLHSGCLCRLQVSIFMKCPVVYTPSEKKVMNQSIISSSLNQSSAKNRSHILNSSDTVLGLFLSYLCLTTIFLTSSLMTLIFLSISLCCQNSPKLINDIPNMQQLLPQDQLLS